MRAGVLVGLVLLAGCGGDEDRSAGATEACGTPVERQLGVREGTPVERTGVAVRDLGDGRYEVTGRVQAQGKSLQGFTCTVSTAGSGLRVDQVDVLPIGP